MRKVFLMLLLACILAMPACALAQTQEPKVGFTGPVATKTVMEALEMRDDAPVILEGNILRSLGSEKYEFADKTGKVIIEIDDDYNWDGQSVSPDDTVVIYGEVERDFKEFVIEVDRVVKK